MPCVIDGVPFEDIVVSEPVVVPVESDAAMHLFWVIVPLL